MTVKKKMHKLPLYPPATKLDAEREAKAKALAAAAMKAAVEIIAKELDSEGICDLEAGYEIQGLSLANSLALAYLMGAGARVHKVKGATEDGGPAWEVIP